jgi:hypothetical protein
MNGAVPIFFASPDVRLRPAWTPDKYPRRHRHGSSIIRAALSTGGRANSVFLSTTSEPPKNAPMTWLGRPWSLDNLL